MKNNISILLSRVLAFFVLLAIVAQTDIGAAAAHTDAHQPKKTKITHKQSEDELNEHWDEGEHKEKRCLSKIVFDFVKSQLPTSRAAKTAGITALITALYMSGYDYGLIDKIVASIIPTSLTSTASCLMTDFYDQLFNQKVIYLTSLCETSIDCAETDLSCLNAAIENCVTPCVDKYCTDKCIPICQELVLEKFEHCTQACQEGIGVKYAEHCRQRFTALFKNRYRLNP